MRLPPDEKTVSPAVLFRSLLPLSPAASIPFRFADVAHGPLRVRAIHSLAANQVHDEAQCLPEDRRPARVQAGYVALSLIDHTGGPLFSCPEEVESLPDHEFATLARCVWIALSTVGPLIREIDLDAWQAVLCRGVRDPSNAVQAYAMGQAYEVEDYRYVDRPERYWGVPVADLLDGHWLAHRAARAVWDERHKRR